MKSILKTLALAVAIIPCAAIGGSTPIQLDGWEKSAWSGCEVETLSQGDSSKAMIFKGSEKSQPWCGVAFFTAGKSSESSNAIKLPPSLKDSFLCFKVNGSDDEFGRHAGGQGMQISIGERVEDAGEWESRFIHGPFVPLSGFIADVKSVDNDPSTWQSVRIPLDSLLRDKKIGRLGYISFQYMDRSPNAGIMIKDISLETPEK